jgi:hypothetical protein
MPSNKTAILVYAHWKGMAEPLKMGTLTAQEAHEMMLKKIRPGS